MGERAPVSTSKAVPIARPRASFMFNPRAWILSTMSMSLTQRGRLFTDICLALDRKDRIVLGEVARFGVDRASFRDVDGARRTIPTAVKRAVFERDGMACRLCGAEGQPLELDHVVRYREGGPDTVENLRVACLPCNRRRG